MVIVKTELGYELRFFNEITNRPGRIIAPDGFKCAGCGKIIVGDCNTYSHSLNLYHPKCYEELGKDFIIILDEAAEFPHEL